jgi:hypothetical protein
MYKDIRGMARRSVKRCTFGTRAIRVATVAVRPLRSAPEGRRSGVDKEEVDASVTAPLPSCLLREVSSPASPCPQFSVLFSRA